MKRFEGLPMMVVAGGYCRMCSVVVLGVLSVLPLVRAQQKEVSRASACVPSDLAALIVPDGLSVRVSPVAVLGGQERSALEHAENGPAILSPFADRTAREAYKVFEREARQGHPAAMVNLAVSSLAGRGTPPNAGAALYWLQEAVNRGYAPASYNLGILYFKGCGVQQDYAEALRFFDQASRSGDAASEVNLGYMYDHGLGVIQNHAVAASWYRQAAERGEPKLSTTSPICTSTGKEFLTTRPWPWRGSRKPRFRDTPPRASCSAPCTPSAAAPLKICNPPIFGSPPPLSKVTPAAAPRSYRSKPN